MGFNSGKICVKATNISVMDRKGEFFLGCQVMSGTITDTGSANFYLNGRVTDVPRDSLHSTMPGIVGHTGRSTWHAKKRVGMYS